MATATNVSDGALSVFAFAIYHQLQSGEAVSAVIRRDGMGHHANEDALAELEQLGMVKTEEDRIVFSDKGQEVIRSLIDSMRQGLPRQG